jgi:hypothetical protein
MKTLLSKIWLLIACLFFIHKHSWTDAMVVWLIGCAYLDAKD